MRCPFCGEELQLYRRRLLTLKETKRFGGTMVVCHKCLIKWYQHPSRKTRLDMDGWEEIYEQPI